MIDQMIAAIQNSYISNQKKRRKDIKKLAIEYYRKSRNVPHNENLWSSLYADGPMGRNIHKAVAGFLTGITGKCCYCQEKIFHNANANIEHILPRDQYPQFTFTPHNLAAACITCNALKTNHDFYNVNRTQLSYSKFKDSWTCFHPNFHNFNDHVRMFCYQSNYVYIRTYIGKTNEGKALCDNHLLKITHYETKASANPVVAASVSQLKGYLSSNGKPPGPALSKFLQVMIANI